MSHSEAARSPTGLTASRAGEVKVWSAPMVFMVAGGIAVLLPYLLLPVVPGTDYPNHLARLAVLGALPGSAIRASYAPHWALMPNLGLELVYMGLKPFASADAVMRLCLVGALAAMLGCAAAIQRTLFGRSSAALALMPLCVAGLPVVMGYVNFVMSCAFVLLGAWLSLKWRSRLDPPRVLALAAAGAAAWLCHFAGYAMLMVFILCSRLHESQLRAAAGRSRVLRLGKAVLPVLAIALPGLIMSALAERGAGSGSVGYGFLKFRCLLAPIVATGLPSDYPLWIGVCVVLLLVVRPGSWRVAPAARLPLFVLMWLMVLLPCRIGAAVDVDSRLAAPLALILLACSRIEPPGRFTRGHGLLAFLAVLIAARDASLLDFGLRDARSVDTFRAIDKTLPADAALMVTTDQLRAGDCTPGGPYPPMNAHTHLAAYATVDRGIWEPFIFAGRGMQPIRSVKPGFPASPSIVVPPSLAAVVQNAGAGAAAAGPGSDPDAEKMPPGWPQRFSYLLVLGHGCHANPIPALLRPQAEGQDFTLFSIVHAARD